MAEMEIARIGQELFGAESKRREIDLLERAFEEATQAGQQEIADALQDRLAELCPLPENPIEWFGLKESYTAELLEAIAQFIRRFVVLHDDQEAILAVWILHTYTFKLSYFTPYIAITAAEKACGKSTLMDTLRTVAHNPRWSSGITAAALVRVVDRDQPTLFLDETDALLKSNQELAAAVQGILNAGFQRDGVFIKCDGKNNDVRDFAVYCPKCVAGIGNLLHDSTASRSIRIEMRRKIRGERAELFDAQQATRQAAAIKKRAADWAEVVGPLLHMRHPQVEEWDGRQNDTAGPLLSIAYWAGEAWRNRVLAALRLTFKSDGDATESFGTMLLSDIRDHFNERRGDRTTSFELLEHLHQLEDRPWLGWGHKREKMQPYQLSNELRKYGVRPQTIRVAGGTPKGYYRADFEDAWQRLCPLPVARGATAATPPRPVYSLTKSVVTGTNVAASEAQQGADEPGLDF